MGVGDSVTTTYNSRTFVRRLNIKIDFLLLFIKRFNEDFNVYLSDRVLAEQEVYFIL